MASAASGSLGINYSTAEWELTDSEWEVVKGVAVDSDSFMSLARQIHKYCSQVFGKHNTSPPYGSKEVVEKLPSSVRYFPPPLPPPCGSKKVVEKLPSSVRYFPPLSSDDYDYPYLREIERTNKKIRIALTASPVNLEEIWKLFAILYAQLCANGHCLRGKGNLSPADFLNREGAKRGFWSKRESPDFAFDTITKAFQQLISRMSEKDRDSIIRQVVHDYTPIGSKSPFLEKREEKHSNSFMAGYLSTGLENPHCLSWKEMPEDYEHPGKSHGLWRHAGSRGLLSKANIQRYLMIALEETFRKMREFLANWVNNPSYPIISVANWNTKVYPLIEEQMDALSFLVKLREEIDALRSEREAICDQLAQFNLAQFEKLMKALNEIPLPGEDLGPGIEKIAQVWATHKGNFFDLQNRQPNQEEAENAVRKREQALRLFYELKQHPMAPPSPRFLAWTPSGHPDLDRAALNEVKRRFESTCAALRQQLDQQIASLQN